MRPLNAQEDSPDIVAAQVALLREKSPAWRFGLASSLSRTTLELARGAIRRRHPELGEEAVLLLFVAIQYGQPLADSVARYLESRDTHEAP